MFTDFCETSGNVSQKTDRVVLYRNFAIATLIGAPLVVMAISSFQPAPRATEKTPTATLVETSEPRSVVTPNYSPVPSVSGAVGFNDASPATGPTGHAGTRVPDAFLVPVVDAIPE